MTLTRQEREEYSRLKSDSTRNDQNGEYIPKHVALEAIDDLYFEIKDGHYRSLILSWKRKLQTHGNTSTEV